MASQDSSEQMTVAGFNRLWSKNQDNNPYSNELKKQKAFKRTTSTPKRLIICCDGTWFASDKGTQNLPSNVARIGRMIAKEDKVDGQTIPQIVYYQSGVGTGNLTWVDKRVQGAFGHSLDENLCGAYHFLCNNYAPGDEIFLFGFSRGAYTARALAGLIVHGGLLPVHSMTSFYDFYDAYKKHNHDTSFKESKWWSENSENLGIEFDSVKVRFVGVWDTVGSLGLPDSYFTQLTNWNSSYQFHNTKLSSKIQKAAHALALDEHRGAFSPTMWWTDHGKSTDVHLSQCWFPGYHSDVGGGTVSGFNDGTSVDDIALAWMLDEVQGLLKLCDNQVDKFVDKFHKNGVQWGEGEHTDSCGYSYYAPGAGGSSTRTPGQYMDKNEGSYTCESIHPSVRYRMGLMDVKPNEAYKKGWFGSKSVDKYAPEALKTFRFRGIDDKEMMRPMWYKKLANGKELFIPEYELPPHAGSIERRLFPDAVVKALEERYKKLEREQEEARQKGLSQPGAFQGFQPNSGF